MNTLTIEDIKSLARAQRELCFSFYLKTAKAGRQTLENPTRFQGLIRQARERLLRSGVRQTHADKLLEPAVKLLDDYPFWQEQDRGLAVFLSDGVMHVYKIPYEVEPLTIDGGSYHLKPLLPLLANDGSYFILALSKQSVTLHRGSRYMIEEVSVKDLPQSESEALRYDDPEKSLQVHAGQPGSRGEQTAVVHGQGAIKENSKERTLRFFQLVNQLVQAHLKDQHAPLLLAGVEYYLPIYRRANTYPHLVDDIIAGSPENRSPDELRQAAWEKLKPIFQQAQEQAAAAIEAGLAKELATDDLEQAVVAAHQGRVDKCMVALDEHCWGAFDAPSGTIAMLDPQDPLAIDLLDDVAVQTLLHGGDAFPTQGAGAIPGGGPLAVLYRF